MLTEYLKDESNSFNYGVKIPVFLEKQFRIKKYPVSVGIISDCLTLSGGWNKYMHKSTYESYLSPTPTVHEYESTNISPTDLYIYNPFGNYVKAYFKFYF